MLTNIHQQDVHFEQRPDTYSLQRELTEKDLRLWDPPTVNRVIHFFEKMELLSQTQKSPIKIAVHISPMTRDRLVYEIVKERVGIFANEHSKLINGNALIFGGHQVLTNAQIYNVLRYIVRPKTRYRMMKILCKSV